MKSDEALGLRGVRFAPSPTGRFHVGNLRTAWASWFIAKALNQPWIVRIEDIDRLRVLESSWSDPNTGQLAEMNALGLVPHEIYRQSERFHRHAALFQKAIAEDKVYPCDCSRSDVRAALQTFASAPHQREPEYSGHCRELDRNRKLQPAETLAWRWRAEDSTGKFDSVIARTRPDGTDFQPGYHFACAVDDADGAYRLLVRAWDLASADHTQRQIRSWVAPSVNTRVFHTALVTLDNGKRLEKRTAGITLGELLEAGVTPADLLRKFENSFDSKSAFDIITNAEQNLREFPTLGEAQRALTLQALSIRV